MTSTYVRWMQLTDHGKKKVSEAELEAIGVRRIVEAGGETTALEQVAAKRRYEESLTEEGT